VSSYFQPIAATSSQPFPAVTPQACWYAVHIRAKHEKYVVKQLEQQGITTFLPLVNEVHRWSDRKKTVQMPLFSCYAFVNLAPLNELRAKVVMTAGVLRFVGAGVEGTPIPDSEIESVRTLLKSTAKYSICPFLNIGQRVRVRGGSLDGIEGILVARNSSRSLIISVEPIQRSLAVSIDDYHVEAI
jgi:transcription antitermination factor NusG